LRRSVAAGRTMMVGNVWNWGRVWWFCRNGKMCPKYGGATLGFCVFGFLLGTLAESARCGLNDGTKIRPNPNIDDIRAKYSA
jgi:hypothetical protein